MQALPSLPPTMWLLPDGTDLRLCRLAMAGLALVRGGRVLRSAEECGEDEGSGEQCSDAAANIQLAVQPAALQAWLSWQQQEQQKQQPVDAAGAIGSSPAPVELLEGVRFGSVQEAAVAAQRWCWRHCPSGWGRERVCTTHLCAAGDAAASAATHCSCSWLHSCELGSGAGGQSDELRLLGAEAVAAAAASSAWLGQHAAALDAHRPRWVHLGALFVEEEQLGGFVS